MFAHVVADKGSSRRGGHDKEMKMQRLNVLQRPLYVFNVNSEEMCESGKVDEAVYHECIECFARCSGTAN
jgi:hypothetical protein